MTKRTRQCGMMLSVAMAVALCAAQEPVVVRLRDAVGDTVDLAERDSFGLFPNTAGFQHAVILALPGPEFYAEITRPRADSIARIFLRIMPTDLERIRFLVDNHGDVAAQQRSDSSYAQALASFWHTIEDKPLRNMAGEPAIEEEAPPATTEVVPPSEPATEHEFPPVPPEEVTTGEPPDTTTASRPPLQPASSENRYYYTLHGATVGSVAGGFLASKTSIGVPVVGRPASLAIAVGATALGTYAGYRYGDRLDRNSAATLRLPREGHGWRTCCAIGACVPGLTLGIAATALVVQMGEYGGEAWIPAVLSGLCITVEVVTLGYRLGRSIDRGNAY
jgi:hypothetical protein